jgi:hypothetical protein
MGYGDEIFELTEEIYKKIHCLKWRFNEGADEAPDLVKAFFEMFLAMHKVQAIVDYGDDKDLDLPNMKSYVKEKMRTDGGFSSKEIEEIKGCRL